MHVYLPVLVVPIELLQKCVNPQFSKKETPLTSKYANVAITTKVLS
jgi:hypothetical protein